MQKKNVNRKIVIAITIIVLFLILLLSQSIIQSQNKRKVALSENTPNEAILVEPNVPVLSAGMIPIKLDGESWIITTQNDKNWYDYKNGKPAYIMLNDGYYRSELERGVEEEQLATNNVGVGVPDDPQKCGSIYMWIPRFAINSETNEIKYIPEETQLGESWKVPDIFSYKIKDETKLDFSLHGAWIEIDENSDLISIITEMNGEEGKYGFIANTKARQITIADVNTIETYLGNNTLAVSLGDLTNLNRIILQVINTNEHEPIKAKALYDAVNDKIKIEVTAHKNPIVRIEDINGKVLSTNSETALMDKNVDEATIIDNKGNRITVNRFVLGAGNSKYHVTDAGTLILNTQNQSRKWYKRYDGLAIVGIHLYTYNRQEWVVPILISTLDEATYTRTSGGIPPTSNLRVIKYHDVEYYYFVEWGVPHRSGNVNSDFPFTHEGYDESEDDGSWEYWDMVVMDLLDQYFGVK